MNIRPLCRCFRNCRINSRISRTSSPPVQEEIRVCQKNSRWAERRCDPGSPAGPAAGDTSISAERTPHPPYKSGEVLTMAIKELGNFEYDADKGGIPPDVMAMTGRRSVLTAT